MSQSPPEHRPRGISGKKVLLISLIACVAIPFVAFFIPVLMIESNKQPPAALDWSQREDWEIVPVRSRVLRWGDTPRPPFEGREVSELPFDLPLEIIDLNQKLAEKARGTASIGSIIKPGTLSDFYAAYLIGRNPSWLNDDLPSLEMEPTASYTMAPKVLVWRFVDLENQPFANKPVGTIELVMTRLKDDVLDESLRLVYPDLTTDADGRVWLPVYDTVYSLGNGTRWAEGLEVEPGLTRWFESPGKVGALPDAVVRDGQSPEDKGR